MRGTAFRRFVVLGSFECPEGIGVPHPL